MKTEKLIPVIICIIFVASIQRVYAFDTQGTYTGTLTEGYYDPFEVYLNGNYISNYTDYYAHEVDLAKGQQIHLTLEIPSDADFDLFVYKGNESQPRWGSYSSHLGQTENLEIAIPEDGYYWFEAADYSGSGSYTIRWETVTTSPSPSPTVPPTTASPTPPPQGADTKGTYTDSLTENADPIEVYLNGEYMGNYTDYKMYKVYLNRDQKIELKLDVPQGSDFDLYVYTANETKGWGSYSSELGKAENINVTIPESAFYKFYVMAYKGGGTYTLRWETPGTTSETGIPSYVWYVIAAIAIVIIMILIIFLFRRRKKALPPPPGYTPAPPPPPPQPIQGPSPVSTPVRPAPTSQLEQRLCPACGGPLTWIPEYQRWYCYRDGKYV